MVPRKAPPMYVMMDHVIQPSEGSDGGQLVTQAQLQHDMSENV
jgi:hypothetical protein